MPQRVTPALLKISFLRCTSSGRSRYLMTGSVIGAPVLVIPVSRQMGSGEHFGGHREKGLTSRLIIGVVLVLAHPVLHERSVLNGDVALAEAPYEPGQVDYLRRARARRRFALKVRLLRGAGRPLRPGRARYFMLGRFSCITG